MIVSAVPPSTTTSQQQYNDNNNNDNSLRATSSSRMQRQSSTATQITSNTQQQQQHSFIYGRVSYKGVVALLVDNNDCTNTTTTTTTAVPSGGYVAYGDVLQLYKPTTSTSTPEYYQVHSVLTGGYAVPSSSWGWCPAQFVETPTQQQQQPHVERGGGWYYKVISTTPLPILTGPVHDAPKTKAVALPGSVQAIATRVVEKNVVWLQLQHRRGWMADRQGTTCVVQETEATTTTRTSAGSGGASRCSADGCSSVVTRSTRHRPPRRRRDAFPRHVKEEEPPPIPSSNVSILSDDSFHTTTTTTTPRFPTSPASSLANTSTSRTTTATTTSAPSPLLLSLMQVTAPRGLTILDAPHWQVQHHFVQRRRHNNNHRRPTSTSCCSHIIYDGKTRRLPCGALFTTAAPAPEPGYDGAQLLQLSDQSGWLVVPTNTSSYVPVGDGDSSGETVWLRVTVRSGVPLVLCPTTTTTTTSTLEPPSPRSDGGSSSTVVSEQRQRHRVAADTSTESSSMMMRMAASSSRSTGSASGSSTPTTTTTTAPIVVIPCGMCVPVQAFSGQYEQQYARLRDGQGWIPLTTTTTSSSTSTTVPLAAPPTLRHGSLWFRVAGTSRVKVRTGPSSRAPSLKTDNNNNVHFRCGEHVRASAVLTVNGNDKNDDTDAWCQLYRHRHRSNHHITNSMMMMTPGEWVPLQSLRACSRPPVMERHRQGWRYRVVDGVVRRHGPSVAAEAAGVIGRGVLVVNERVTSSDDDDDAKETTWLRCKDGSGWVQWTTDVVLERPGGDEEELL